MPNMWDGVSERANMVGDTQGIISTGTAEPKHKAYLQGA